MAHVPSNHKSIQKDSIFNSTERLSTALNTTNFNIYVQSSDIYTVIGRDWINQLRYGSQFLPWNIESCNEVPSFEFVGVIIYIEMKIIEQCFPVGAVRFQFISHSLFLSENFRTSVKFVHGHWKRTLPLARSSIPKSVALSTRSRAWRKLWNVSCCVVSAWLQLISVLGHFYMWVISQFVCSRSCYLPNVTLRLKAHSLILSHAMH